MEESITGREDFEIRNYRRDDLVDLVSLLERNNMFHPERDGRLLALGHGDRLVATLGNAVIGHVYAGDKNGIPVVGGLVVDAAYRNQGIGSLLMGILEHRLIERGRKTMEIQVDGDRPGLMAWYQRQGFMLAYTVHGCIKELHPPNDANAVAEAFETVRRLPWATFEGVYSLEGMLGLRESMLQSPDADLNLAGTKVRIENMRGAGIPLTPWCMSIGVKGDMVRWGRIPMKNAHFDLLREIRVPMASRPKTNPQGADMDIHGNYLLRYGGYKKPPEIRAFAVVPEESGVILLEGEQLSVVFRDLTYAAGR